MERDSFYYDQLNNHTSYRITNTMHAELYWASELREVIEYIRSHIYEEIYVTVENKSSEQWKIVNDTKAELFNVLGAKADLVRDVG